MRVKFLATGNKRSVSFWSSYVSFRMYCFTNACDTLFLPRDWRPMYAGVVWERENVIFIFNRGESYFVVLLIMLLSSLFSFMFFYTASFFFSDLADLLHFVHSDIYLISQASFFLRIISKLGNSLYLADLLHFVHSDIYLISQASFFVRIISKLGNSFYLADFFPQPLIT